MKAESQEMSLWLSVSVFLLSIGIGTMIISLIKRHRLSLEAAVYSSIGSLKRLKRKSSMPRDVKESKGSPDITTATEVAFFPRYSVVNKSWRVGRNKEGRMGSRVFHLEEVLSRVTELNQGEKIELLEFR